MTLHASVIDSPVGPLLALVDGAGVLTALPFVDPSADPVALAHRTAPEDEIRWDDAPAALVRRQLEEYFARQRRAFTLRVAPRGTAFQLAVWQALQRIPYGQTVGYGELARRLGKPSASRAVGRANGANPIPVIVPCHRVVGVNGALTGYGGGIDRKRALLELEGALLALEGARAR